MDWIDPMIVAHSYDMIVLYTEKIFGNKSCHKESIQVANRLIDPKHLNRFTETIHYFYNEISTN